MKIFFTRRSNDSLSFYIQTKLQTYHILGGHYTLLYTQDNDSDEKYNTVPAVVKDWILLKFGYTH